MNFRIVRIPIIVSLSLLVACNQSEKKNTDSENDNLNQIENPTNKVVLSSEIEWEKLNLARGDDSPQAGTI